MATIPYLPSEIIRMISRLSTTREDIQNFRLVDKRFGIIGAEPLAKTLHVTFQRRSFENLKRIATNSGLCKYVKQIMYEADILPRVNRRRWDRSIRSIPARLRSTQHIPTRIRIDEDNAKYNSYVEEMERVVLTKASSLDFTTFASAFMKFPQLQGIQLVLRGGYKFGENLHDSSETLRYAFKDVLEPNQEIPFEAYEPHTALCDPNYGIRQMKSILPSAVAAGVKLKHFKCGPFDWSFFETGRSDENGQNFAGSPELYLPAFVHLVSLHIIIQYGESQRRRDEGKLLRSRAARLGEAIGTAKDLTSLKVNLEDPRKDGPYNNTTWDSIALSTTWSKLEHLELTNMSITEVFFTEFLRSHAKTLKSMSFSKLLMSKGSWRTFFKNLKYQIHKGDMLWAVQRKEDMNWNGELLAVDDAEELELELVYMDMLGAGWEDGLIETFGERLSRFLLDDDDGGNPFEMANYQHAFDEYDWDTLMYLQQR